MKQLLLIFVLLANSITNAQTFDFSCAPEKTRFEIIEALSIPGEVDVHAEEEKITTTQAGNQNISYLTFPNGEQLSTMSEATFLVIKGQVEDIVYNWSLAGIADLAASRTVELKALSTATTSVTISWGNGHTITVDGNDILANTYGPNNYGRASIEQFDALYTAVENAVAVADTPLSLGDARKQLLEDLSRDGVFVNVTTDAGGFPPADGYTIKYLDAYNNVHSLDDDPQITYGYTKLEDLTDFETSLYINTRNRVTDIVNANVTYDAFTVTEIDAAVAAATTTGVDVSWSYGNFGSDHSEFPGHKFVRVTFTDKTDNGLSDLTNQFLNGEKALEAGTSDEFDAWVATWSSLIIAFQADVRIKYINKLEAAFNTQMTTDTSIVEINLGIDENGNDEIVFSGAGLEQKQRFNELLQDLPELHIDAAIAALSFNVDALQYQIDAAAQAVAATEAKIADFKNQVDTAIANAITASVSEDVGHEYSNSDPNSAGYNYAGNGDAIVFVNPLGETGENVHATIQFGGFLEDLEQYQIDAVLAQIPAQVIATQAWIDAGNGF